MGEEQKTQHVLAEWTSEDPMGEATVQPMNLNPNICPGCPLSVLMAHGSNRKNNLSILSVYLWNSLDTNLEAH